MSERKIVMLELDASDTVLLLGITEHLRQPFAATLRQALRHYALTGNWPIGTNGLREAILDAAHLYNCPPKPRRKA